MNILYGVCGEGFGHSARAKTIIEYLKSKKHRIMILTYGQAFQALKKFRPEKIEGISLHFKNNKLSMLKTITKNAFPMIKNILAYPNLNKKISKFKPHVCITDMEPLVPIIAHWKNLPLISIDNQHRLTHLKISVPKKYLKSYNLAKTAVHHCVSKANAFIITSFTKQKASAKNVHIVSPILKKEITKLRPKTKNFILVYLTKPNPQLISLLKKFKEIFIVYSSEINKQHKISNLIFKPLGNTFKNDLKNCKAIIATAGFTLISEALYLKKPYFAIPLKVQFEQTLNALFLKKEKLGNYSENPKEKDIKNFIKNLRQYKKNIKKLKSNPNESLNVLDKILLKLQNQKLLNP